MFCNYSTYSPFNGIRKKHSLVACPNRDGRTLILAKCASGPCFPLHSHVSSCIPLYPHLVEIYWLSIEQLTSLIPEDHIFSLVNLSYCIEVVLKLGPRPHECIFKSLRFHFTENAMKVLCPRDRFHIVLPVHTKTTESTFNLLLCKCRRYYLNLGA